MACAEKERETLLRDYSRLLVWAPLDTFDFVRMRRRQRRRRRRKSLPLNFSLVAALNSVGLAPPPPTTATMLSFSPLAVAIIDLIVTKGLLI